MCKSFIKAEKTKERKGKNHNVAMVAKRDEKTSSVQAGFGKSSKLIKSMENKSFFSLAIFKINRQAIVGNMYQFKKEKKILFPG